ncbi:MAG: 1,6-anhydro-N-acetylmuramyl-L-alanine amidase AmpD [Psychrobium sp.]|nr:1,6-anhydro-N-acetylmuramyl-L-alanine amidase AmpD [Psychrobium sp.]
MIDQQGWLTNARRCVSPHYNERPNNAQVSLLVIHNISLPPGKFGGAYIDDLFLGQLDCCADPYFAQLRGLQVSAHCLINRLGEITQYVSFNNRAWHAGISQFDGIDNCNDYSIGIELEGGDDTPYCHAQYLSLAMLSKHIQYAYPLISMERITGHSDIAPGRKTDPGPAFDWVNYFDRLQKN